MNIIITGCNRGLGLLLAQELKNHNVIATARNLQSLQEALKNNQHCQLHQLDVQNQESIDAFVKTIKQPIDVLVNNAAVIETQLKGEGTLAKQVFDINYYGVINVTKAILPYMKQNGKILVISSDLGKLSLQRKEIQDQLKNITEQQLELLVQDFIQTVDQKNDFKLWSNKYKGIYSASKALINAYSRHVLAPGISQQVFCVHPGWLRTDMGGQQAPQPKEEGIITSMYLINNKIEGSGIYFNEKCQQEQF